MSRKKHWNYEDDHDYDDSIDYIRQRVWFTGMVNTILKRI